MKGADAIFSSNQVKASQTNESTLSLTSNRQPREFKNSFNTLFPKKLFLPKNEVLGVVNRELKQATFFC